MPSLDRAILAFGLVLLAGSVAGCEAQEEVGPRLEVQAGSALRTRVRQDSNQELVRLEIAIDGEPLPPEIVGDIGVAITSHADFVCEDRIEDVRSGRVRRATRTFVDVQRCDDSRSSGPEGESTQTSTFTSPLVGRRVAFLWNDRDSRYGATLVSEAGTEPAAQDEDLLDGLALDLDLGAFLPAPGARPGDEWPVSPKALAQLVQPGGDLQLIDPESGHSQAFDAQLFTAHLQGSIHARYLEPEPDQDPGLAVIGLSVRVDTVIEQDLPPELDEFGMPTHSRIEIGYRLKGRLRWDSTAGRARDLELAGKTTADSTQTVTGGIGDDVFEQVDRLHFEGTTRIQVVVEPL